MVERAFVETLTDMLVRKKIVTPADAVVLQETFFASELVRFEEFLLDEDIVAKEQLLHLLQVYYTVPAIDVVGILFDHDLVTQVPKDVLLRFGMIPYVHDGEVLQVIASRPSDGGILPALGEHVSYDIVFAVGLYRDICDAVKEFYDEALTVTHDNEDEAISSDLEDIIDIE